MMTQPLTIALVACALVVVGLFGWTLVRALPLVGEQRRVLRRHVLFGVVLLVAVGARAVALFRGGLSGMDALLGVVEPTRHNAVLWLAALGIQVLMAWRVTLARRHSGA